MEKMTKVMKLNAILVAVEGQAFEGFDVKEFLTHEIALLEKRNKAKSENKKPSKTQVENLGHVETINAFLTENANVFYSAKELVDALELDFSSQKMTALMKKAVEQGVEKDKSTAFPKLVGYGITTEVESDEQGE